jgi:hypothetical protein
MSRSDMVRTTCAWVVAQAQHVAIHSEHFSALPELTYRPHGSYEDFSEPGWD